MLKSPSTHLHPISLGRQKQRDRSGIDRALTVIGTSIVCTSFFFVVFPMVDLAISRWFAEGSTFVLGEKAFFRIVRDSSRQGLGYILGAAILVLGLHILLPKRLRFCRPHKLLFILVSFAAGPLVVTETLKMLIGRARPRALVEFGGTADFTPVWQFAAACTHNCSFPSGEASASASALAFLVFVPERLRWIAALILTPCLALIAFNRVMLGAHFLSDVMLAWLLTMFVTVLIWQWIGKHAALIDEFGTGRLSNQPISP